MTVAELITELQKHPQDLQVISTGIEDQGDVAWYATVVVEKAYDALYVGGRIE